MKRVIVGLAVGFVALIPVSSRLAAQGKALLVNSRASELIVDYYPAPHRTELVQVGDARYTGFSEAEAGAPSSVQ